MKNIEKHMEEKKQPLIFLLSVITITHISVYLTSSVLQIFSIVKAITYIQFYILAYLT